MIRKNKKEHLHSPNLRNKSVFRDPIFFSIVVYTFIRSHHLQHFNFNKWTKKKKEKKLKIGFVFLFSPKNYCQIASSWFTHIRMKRIIAILKHTFVSIFPLCIGS